MTDMRFADTLYLPFTQGLYNRKDNYISVILGETDKHRYRLDQIRDGDYNEDMDVELVIAVSR